MQLGIILAGIQLPTDVPPNAFGPPPPKSNYLRPGGVFTYKRPDGTSVYKRP